MACPNKRPCIYISGDLFSNLPKCLVSEILFRLPTKDAVRTSILSKVWQHRWTYSVNVFIDNLPSLPQKKLLSFINAMNKILHHSNNLRSFHLTSKFLNDISSFQTWMSVIPRHKELERFEININLHGTIYPSCLLNSNSLKKVWLQNLRSTLFVAVMNCAPNLTSIYLYGVKIVNDDPSSSTVKFDFPVLENIKLVHVTWVNVKSVEICAPSLTTFTSGLIYGWKDEYLITVVSPRLTSFVCAYGMPEVFITNGSSVESAFLNYEEYEIENPERRETIGLRVNNLANSFTNLKELDLTYFAVEALLLGRGFRGNKVTTLRLHPLCTAEQLLALLHAMPSLKFLVADVYGLDDYDYEAMESVPSCIVSRLEEVVLRSFNAEVAQYHLARFLSKTANQLKKLTLVITRRSSELIPAIRLVLSTFTRRSLMLEIDARAQLGRNEFGSFQQFI